ncbi:MAG: multicopper oxidase domain-containing protein [Chloroflexi bacterium]|nr:multicopper oxidase domain-containing protein [Chloroflexota bacterium]
MPSLWGLRSRRAFLAVAGRVLVAAGIAAPAVSAPVRGQAQTPSGAGGHGPGPGDHASAHGGSNTVAGTVDVQRLGFDPMEMLSEWDYGATSRLPDGRRLREYWITAADQEIEVAPGVVFNAWTYNGRAPGPSLRCIEGEMIQVHFTNGASHAHTIHFHGFHGPDMDGIPGVGRGVIEPGDSFTYEFEARPYGCHLYHCHAIPLKRHIAKGLYGVFVIDPDPARHGGPQRELAARRNHREPACQAINEMVMVMNSFDTDFDGENEVYAANTVAFYYMQYPIPVRRDQVQRLYLVNMTEFDPVNSIHTHGFFFNYYDHGTTLEPTLRMVDTVMQCQGQRGILEFSFADAGLPPGRYMFHAHQSEFAELGWMGFFEVI